MSAVWPLVGFLISWVAAVNGELIVYPGQYSQSTNDSFKAYNSSSTCITLSPSTPNVTLDYVSEVAGFPFLDISNVSKPVQIEAKYSEPRSGLDEAFADGPWTMSNGLSNTFRVETFNITKTGRTESFFQQGGQRWQSLRLLNKDRSVRICGVGTRSLNERTDVDQLPGYFESSNPLYNEIWALGARNVQQACIAKGAAPTTWEVTLNGVLLRGQQSAQSALGQSFSNYTMTFKTEILRGGTGWRVATSTQGFGLTLLLTSEYPADSTFLNTNRTLVPPNTLAVGYGWNLVNQTTLPTGRVSYYPVSSAIKEGKWMSISTRITPSGYVVTIDNETTITVPLKDLQLMSNPQLSTGSVYTGSWGFGPYQDQISYVKDVSVQAKNGTLLYSNPMTNESILEEYGVMDNGNPVCLDGAKRDRLIWSGDFAHTHRIISASTNRTEFIRGTLDFLLAMQEESGSSAGLLAMSPAMGQSAKYTSIYKNYGLIDYQMLILNSFPQYYLDSGDEGYIRSSWNRLKSAVEILLSLVDESGLASGGSLGAFFVGDNDGTAASSLLAFTLGKMAGLAEVVSEPETAKDWTDTASTLSDAVNQQLWNSKLGTYSSSLTSRNESSYIGTTWAILSNTSNATQTASSIEGLSSLRLGIGYKSTSDTASDPSTNLSPNLSGFLLEALFKHARDAPTHGPTKAAINVLLGQLWPAMVNQDEYYTGTSWEYLYPDGRPGLDLFTSHAHPWGGAPTYIFTEYVLGIQPTKPGFEEWAFRPSFVVDDLTWVKGRVPTPKGTIRANWEVDGKDASMEVCGPRGTKGVIELAYAATQCKVNGVQKDCGNDGVHLEVDGRKCVNITLSLAEPIA